MHHPRRAKYISFWPLSPSLWLILSSRKKDYLEAGFWPAFRSEQNGMRAARLQVGFRPRRNLTESSKRTTSCTANPAAHWALRLQLGRNEPKTYLEYAILIYRYMGRILVMAYKYLNQLYLWTRTIWFNARGRTQFRKSPRVRRPKAGTKCHLDLSHLLTALISSCGESNTSISGAGPLKRDTVAWRCSVLPPTSETSGPSRRSAWLRI